MDLGWAAGLIGSCAICAVGIVVVFFGGSKPLPALIGERVAAIAYGMQMVGPTRCREYKGLRAEWLWSICFRF